MWTGTTRARYAQLAIKGFGGGSDYTHSEGHEESESNTSKYENMNHAGFAGG